MIIAPDDAASVMSTPALAFSYTRLFCSVKPVDPLLTKIPSYAPVIDRLARVTASASVRVKAKLFGGDVPAVQERVWPAPVGPWMRTPESSWPIAMFVVSPYVPVST